MSKPTAVIYDMDGTLANVTDIRFLVDKGDPRFIRRDFDLFHRMSEFSPPNDLVVDATKFSQYAGHKVLVVTARPARYAQLTADWLKRHGVPFNELHTRADKDFRPDTLVKQDILNTLQEKFTIIHAYDDNPAVLQVWRDNNIPVTVVPGWSAHGTQRTPGDTA